MTNRIVLRRRSNSKAERWIEERIGQGREWPGPNGDGPQSRRSVHDLTEQARLAVALLDKLHNLVDLVYPQTAEQVKTVIREYYEAAIPDDADELTSLRATIKFYDEAADQIWADVERDYERNPRCPYCHAEECAH